MIGTLAPHLFQSADIPHLTAMTPVLFEFGVITPGLASIIRPRSSTISVPSTKASELKHLKKCAYDVVALAAAIVLQVVEEEDVAALRERRRRREMRPLDKADMADVNIGVSNRRV